MKIIGFVLSLKPEVLFVAIALFFGLISACLVPQLSVNDEGAHFYRSYAISTGNLSGRSCSYPKEIIQKVKASGTKVYSFNIHQKDTGTSEHFNCGTAGSYYPVMHLPQSIGILIGRIVDDSPALMVLLGRVMNLLFFVAAMYMIIKRVAVGKWVFFTLGLLPGTVHSAASLSYDAFNTVIIFAFIALVLTYYGLKASLTLKQLALLIIISVLTAMAKSSNVVLLLLLFVLPTKLFSIRISKYRPLMVKLFVSFGIILVSLASVAIWQKISGSTITSAPAHNRLHDHPIYMGVVLYNTYLNPFFGYTDVVIRGVVGEFSSFQYHLPTLLVIVSFGLITFTLLLEDRLEKIYSEAKNKVLPFASLTVFILSFLLITYALYTIWAALPTRQGPNAFYADGVQGRYFTPLLALFIPIGISLRRYISITTSSIRTSTGIIVATSVLLLAYYTLETIHFASKVTS